MPEMWYFFIPSLNVQEAKSFETPNQESTPVRRWLLRP